MKTIHYKIKGFRLDSKVVQTLEDLKFKYAPTYNLLFKDLILTYTKNKDLEEESKQKPAL